MRPTAIGIDVVPTLKRFRKGTIPGSAQPAPTPISMAVKIHSVRKRSKKLRRDTTLVFICSEPHSQRRTQRLRSLPADVVDFLLEREPVEGREREAQEEADSSIQQKESFTESLLHLLFGSLHGGGIGDTPVGGHRLARPHRADFVRCIVTNGENEIEPGGVRLGELFPALTAQASRGQVSHFQLPQSLGADCSRGMAPGAVRGEIRLALLIRDGFGHDRTRRVPGAQKQNVVVSLHYVLTILVSCSTSAHSTPAGRSLVSRRGGRRSETFRPLAGRERRRRFPARREIRGRPRRDRYAWAQGQSAQSQPPPVCCGSRSLPVRRQCTPPTPARSGESRTGSRPG